MDRKENKLCSSCEHFKTMGKDENRHHHCLKDGKLMIVDHFFISNNGLCDEFSPKSNNNAEPFVPVFGQWYDVNEYLPKKTYYTNDRGNDVYIPFFVTFLDYYDKVTPRCSSLAIYIDGEWRWAEDEGDVLVEITHWMPLPEPAKREVTK